MDEASDEAGMRCVAVFGMLQGRWAQAFRNTLHADLTAPHPITDILQTGNLGAFPNLDTADPKTRKRWKRWLKGQSYQRYLAQDLVAPLPVYFVRGHMEDQRFLGLRRNDCIDPFGRIIQVSPSEVWNLGTPEDPLYLAGIGGIEPHHVDDDPTVDRWGSSYLDPHEIGTLLRYEPESVDILLTHDGPSGLEPASEGDTGSPMIRKIVRHVQPRYHFWGNTDKPSKIFRIGWTRSVRVSQDLDQLDGAGSPLLLDTDQWRVKLPGEEGWIR